MGQALCDQLHQRASAYVSLCLESTVNMLELRLSSSHLHSRLKAPGHRLPLADLGAEVSGRYIVAFRPEAGPATQAAAALRSHVKSQLQQQAAGPVAAAALQSVHVLHTLGDNAAPQAESSNDLSAAPTAAAHAGGAAAAATVPSTGLQAVVMQISHPVALASVRSASSVAAVIPDRVVAAQQDPPAACIDPQQLSQGLAAAEVAKPFLWRSCLTAKTGMPSEWSDQPRPYAHKQLLHPTCSSW